MKQMPTSPAEAFDAWAEEYDAQPNPLLTLEQRVLDLMLPDVRGLDVLDAGCGTGRWLQRLAGRSARTLIGIDQSAEMLRVARAKLPGECDLRHGNCTALPVSDAAADLVLSCFVISYLDDLDAFAHEIDRVARPGATIFLADMHPGTEASLGWTRGMQISPRGWSLRQITQAFQGRGFKLVSLKEPTFGADERRIFEECGERRLYDSATGVPAIYILQLRKPTSSPRWRSEMKPSLLLSGGRSTLTPETAAVATVSIVGGCIHSMQEGMQSLGHVRPSASHVDLSGYLLLPGLINSHDHLEFSLYPNIGDGPYTSAAQWARDIHSNRGALIAQYRRVPRSTCMAWGAVRNLLCGATTVCHHNPVTSELIAPGFPVRVLSEFSWAHSPSLEPNLARKFTESRADQPFILHAGEGVDEGSAEEIFALDRIHALDHRTVLVHGLACDPECVSLINRRMAALILCPTSNEFLFHRSPTLAFIRSLNRVLLGSDSPLTGAGDLLDEIRFTHQHIGLDANSLYAMVTNRPADVLRLRRGEGYLKPGSVADLLVVRDGGLSPAETLVQLTSSQIELVVVGGQIRLAGPALIERLPSRLREGLRPLEVDQQTRWVRAPIDEMLAEAEQVLGTDLRLGGKRVGRASAA